MTAARKLESRSPAKRIGRPPSGTKPGHGLEWRQRTLAREKLALEARKLHHALDGALTVTDSGAMPARPTLVAIFEQLSLFCVDVLHEVGKPLP